MTVIDEGLVAFLLADDPIIALVSDRVYGVRIPQGSMTFPLVVVQRVSTARILTMDGSGASGDLISPRFQIDAYGVTHASAKAVTEAVRAALHGHTGATGGVAISAALANEEALSYDEDTKLYRIRSEYIVWLEE